MLNLLSVMLRTPSSYHLFDFNYNDNDNYSVEK